MKALLRIFYFFVVLIVLLLLAGLFLPKNAHVESSITVNASPNILFDQVNDLHNWRNWSPWFSEDTTMKITFGDKTKGVGASYSWISKHSGDGSLIVSKSYQDSLIQTKLDFHTAGTAYSPFKFESEGKLTKVTWAYDNPKLSYLERYFVVLFRKNIMKMLQKGLNGLKHTAEELRLSRISDITLMNIPERNIMAIKDSVKINDFAVARKKTTERVLAYLGRRQIDTVGMPFTIIYDWKDTASVVFECALPIPSRTWGWGEYKCTGEPAVKAAMVTHYGDFNSKKAFKALENYAKKKSLTVTGPPWVKYLLGPDKESDTSKWKMRVYMPVK